MPTHAPLTALHTKALDYLRTAELPAGCGKASDPAYLPKDAGGAARSASSVAIKLGVTVQKATAILRRLVADGHLRRDNGSFGYFRYYVAADAAADEMTPDEARDVLAGRRPGCVATALYVLGQSVAAEKDGRPRLPLTTTPPPVPSSGALGGRLYGPDGLDESGWEKAMVGPSAFAAAIGEPAEAEPTPHPALAALSDDPTEAVEIDEWLCGPVASRPGQTRLAAGDVCTVRDGGQWEVSFSANDGDVREALHNETVRRFDERSDADAYHAELVEQFASMAAKDDRAGEPTIYEIADEQDDELVEEIVQTPAFDPETVNDFIRACWRKANDASFAAGQQVQTEDAARNARQERHILAEAVDRNDPGDPYQGRVTEPAGVPRAARPFRGEEAP